MLVAALKASLPWIPIARPAPALGSKGAYESMMASTRIAAML
jgi:hypothetical protein